MESLEIINFLSIKQAKLDVKKINIIIGEQATGKSIIAKLLCFFRQYLFLKLTILTVPDHSESNLKKELISKFEDFFPRYIWKEQEFEIVYTFGEIKLTIQTKTIDNGQLRLNVIYSNGFKDLYNKISKEVEDIIKNNETLKNNSLILETIRQIQKSEIGQVFQQPLFIPAGRSFFAILQRNIFAFLANNLEIDPLMREFGSNYEIAKRYYKRINESQTNQTYELDKMVNKIISTIIKGKYAYERDEDWIYSENRQKVNLINASSGQQEALPMLLVLEYLAKNLQNIPMIFLIEEPEAHLFPFAQKYMVDLFALLYRQKSCSFFITTHSPYILTAFNNRIMAGNKRKENPQPNSETDNYIDYDDVGAYTIKDGILETILDEEVLLIGTNIIDSVSDELGREFDSFLED